MEKSRLIHGKRHMALDITAAAVAGNGSRKHTVDPSSPVVTFAEYKGKTRPITLTEERGHVFQLLICWLNSRIQIALSNSKNAVSFSSACTTNRFPSSRCASAIQIVLASRSTAETQPQLPGALAAKRQKEQTLAEQTRAMRRSSYNQGPQRDTLQVVTKEKTAKNTQTIAHYSYKTPEGKKESVAVITQYYPKQIVYPFAKIDRRIDGKLMRAATIAQERAHAHSRSMCWHYVKEALLASGVIDSRPKSELAKDAAQDLVSNYGFKKLSVSDPFAAPVGSVLVYGANHAAGHVEIRTQEGFVSDFFSKTPSPRPLLGVYAKL